MTPELLAKRKLQLTLAARNAVRKAGVLHEAAIRAKAAAKAARKASKLARKTARKAAKKARQHAKDLKAFLKSTKRVRPPNRSKAKLAKPGVSRKRKSAARAGVSRTVVELPAAAPIVPANP